MNKHYFLAGLFVGLFMFVGAKAYAEDDTALMGCLLRSDKHEIIECLKKDLPNSSFFFANKCLLCQSNNFSEEMRMNCEKEKAVWLDELLENWRIIYSQCLKGMTVSECISQIKLTPCEKAGKGEDAVGSFGKGTCYALAAFMKRDSSVCENQFYSSTKDNCNIWLNAMCSDNARCKESSFIKNEGKYFNWIYEDGTAGMEEIGFCKIMKDLDKRNRCFLSAGNCEEITEVQIKELCNYNKSIIF